MLRILRQPKANFAIAKFGLNATNNEAYSFSIKISTGEIRFEDIVAWLKNNAAEKNKIGHFYINPNCFA
jgi:hypothetical protein